MTWKDILKDEDRFGVLKPKGFKDKVKTEARRIVKERHGLKFNDFLNAEQKREEAYLADLMFRGMSPEEAKLQPYNPPQMDDDDDLPVEGF